MAEEQDLTDAVADSAVADAPVVDTPAAPVDDLDELLRQFTDSTAQSEQPQVNDAAAERDRAFAANLNAITEGYAIDARREQLQAEALALKQEVDRKDALAAFETIRAGLPAEMFDDRMIWAWLQARGDPAIDAVFENRTADPKTYQRTITRLAIEFGEKFRRYEPEAEIDHAAVAQAVRGASEKVGSEPPPNLGRLSNNEYRRYVQDNFGYDPNDRPEH